MTCNRYSVRFVLAAVAVFGTAGAAMGQQMVPLLGVLHGSYTSTPVPPFPPQFIDVQLAVTGHATHLGRFTAVCPHRVNVSTVPSTGVGTWTFTAANGDTLQADVTGQGTQVAPGLLHVVEMGTITGGTGRFADASGEFVMQRLLDQVNLTTIGFFNGRISRPGKAKN
jgi:hypothetical protein